MAYYAQAVSIFPGGGLVLLLVTIGLVVVGAVSLVIGFVQNSLPPIYVSIVCSLLAAGVLILFSRMSRRQAASAGLRSVAPVGGPTATSATAATASTATPLTRSPEFEEEPTVVPMPSRTPMFPIAEYDDLRVAEILPLLEELEDDELEEVLDRERGDRNRATIVRRIEELLRPSVVVLDTGARRDEPVEQGAEDEVIFPIADYDDLRIGEILPLLPELDDVELVMVREREVAGRSRASVLRGIGELLGEAPPAPATRAPAKKAPAKKAPAKKAAATKSAAKTTAATKSTPAKAAGTKKAAGKAAGSTKSAAKKASPPAKTTRATKSSPRNPPA
jgi:hypothetical protein